MSVQRESDFGQVTSTDSQQHNCTSLVVQIGAFPARSIFFAPDNPIGQLPLRGKSLTNHREAFVTKGKIMIIVILRISQIIPLFHLKFKLQGSNAAEAKVALQAERQRDERHAVSSLTVRKGTKDSARN